MTANRNPKSHEDASGTCSNFNTAKRLNAGKIYSESFEKFKLTFVPYRLKNKKVVSTVISAAPIKSEGHKKAHNIFSELGSYAVDELKRVWKGFNDRLKHTPILEYTK